MVSCANNFRLTISVLQHKDPEGEHLPPVVYTWCKQKVEWFCFASTPVGFFFFPRCKQEKPEGFVAAGPGFHRKPKHRLTHEHCLVHTFMNIDNFKANPNLTVSFLAGNSFLFPSEKLIGGLDGKIDV